MIDLSEIEAIDVKCLRGGDSDPVIRLRLVGRRFRMKAWGIDPYWPEAQEFFEPLYSSKSE